MDSTTGDIDIDSLATGTVTVGTLNTGNGNVRFDQTGGQTLNVTQSTTTAGDIDISNDAGVLNAAEITAGATGNISLTTTTSGSVHVGDVDADGNTVTITSADSIQELAPTDAATDIVADTLNLTSVNGIGDGEAIETTVNILTFTNTSGNVQITNSQSLNLLASSNGGDIELCLTSGDLMITDMLSATGNTIRLQADTGSVVETGAGTITADALGVRAFGDITLEAATNAVNNVFAADSAVGSVSFTNSLDIWIDTVTAGDCFAALSGVTTTTGSVTLDATPNARAVVFFEGVTTGSGNIDVDAVFVEILAPIMSMSGNIEIDAFTSQRDDISTGAAGTIRVTGSDILMDAATTSTDTGSIVYDAVNLVGISALSSISGDITVTASLGQILDFSATNELPNISTSGTGITHCGERHR